MIIDYRDYPIRPIEYDYSLMSKSYDIINNDDQLIPLIKDYESFSELTIDIGDILPKSEVWTLGVIYIGGETSEPIEIEGKLFGSNIGDPINVLLKIHLNSEKRPMKKEDVERSIEEDSKR